VDGTSFALMRRRKIRHAFAFDRHFASAGFIRVPLDTALAD
jgi:predicted nucleic acid-binding protein